MGKFIGKITAFIKFVNVNSIDCKNKTEHSLMHLGDKKERWCKQRCLFKEREPEHFKGNSFACAT